MKYFMIPQRMVRIKNKEVQHKLSRLPFKLFTLQTFTNQ